MLTTRLLAGNMFVQMTSKAAAVLLGLVAVGILSRTLDKSGFGEYTTAMTFLQIFGVLVDFGLTLTLVVMISEPKANESKIVSNIFTMRLILGALIYTISPLAALFVPQWSGDVRLAVGVGAIAYLFSSCASILVGVFQKHAVMWRAAIVEFLNRAALVVTIAIFAYVSPTVVSLVAASAVANAIWLAATIFFARPYVRIGISFDKDVWKTAAHRSWPLAISILFNMIYLRGDVFFLSLFREPAEVGVYGLAYKVIDVLQALPVMFMGLLLPSLVADWNAGRHFEFRQHLERAFNFFAIIGIPILVGAQVAAEPITVLIAGEAYRASGTVLQVLILAVIGVFFGGLYGWTVVALEKQHTATWLYALTAFLSVIGYVLFIPPFGMWGAVWVTVASETLIAVGTFWLVRRTSGAVIKWRSATKALFSSIVMYLVLVALVPHSAVLQIPIGAFVYGIVMVAIGGIRTSTLRELLPERIAEHTLPPRPPPIS